MTFKPGQSASIPGTATAPRRLSWSPTAMWSSLIVPHPWAWRRHPRAAALPRPPQRHAHGRYTELRSDRFDGFWKDWPTEDFTQGVRFGRPTPGAACCPPFRRRRARKRRRSASRQGGV